MARGPKNSKLFAKSWIVPEVGSFYVVRATIADARIADRDWAPKRPADDENQHWRWTEIIPAYPDQFAVKHGDGKLAGLWTARGPITVKGVRLYRVDYIEIDPALRSIGNADGTFGYFVFSLVAGRARERLCVGLAIPSLPATTKIYEKMGAVAGVEGWNLSPPIAPYRMIGEPYERLMRLADEYEEKD